MKSTTLIGSTLAALVLGWAGVGCSGAEARDPGADDEDTGIMSEAALRDAVGSSAFMPQGHLENVLRGAKLFFFEFPGLKGNGRACATCHRPEDGFGLSPKTVEARYRATGGRDPLFRSVDADDGKNDYTSLRQKALIRVTLKLPPNMKLADDPAATHVTVLRAVPSVLDIGFTAPYQQDGRQPNLESQALAALHDHSEIKREPASKLLGQVSEFQKVLFSSPGMYLVAKAMEAGKPPPDPDPPLSAYEQQGKALFPEKCGFCHGGAAGTVPAPGLPQMHDLLVSGPRPPSDPWGFKQSTLPVRPYIITLPDGSIAPCKLTGQPEPCPSTDPGVALLTGKMEDFNAFDIPPVRGLRFTAPYFHDNSAATIEEMMDHYVVLFRFLNAVGAPGIPTLSQEESNAITAYLKKI